MPTMTEPTGTPEPVAGPRVRSRVVTVSDRCRAGEREDASGHVLVDWLASRGHDVDTALVGDGEPAGAAVLAALEAGVDLVLTTGGTGVGPRDLTPEVVRPLLDVEVPGLVELVRRVGLDKGLPGAALTRGVAGISTRGGQRAAVVTLPGSPGACRDAVGALDPVLGHLLAQVRGADH